MKKSLGFNLDMQEEVIGVLYLSVFKNVLESEGLELRGYQGKLSDLSNCRKRISPATFYQVLTQSLEKAPEGLGLSYGKQLNLIAADSVGQLIMSCSTLMQALEAVQHYRLLLAIPLNIEYELGQTLASVRFEQLNPRKQPLSFQWFTTETIFTCCLHQARWLKIPMMSLLARKGVLSRWLMPLRLKRMNCFESWQLET